MSAPLKPLVHWVIYKGFRIRYTGRTPSHVAGILTTDEGEVEFEYDPIALCISLPDRQVFINHHGWELTEEAL